MSFHNCLIIRNYSKSFLNTFSINFNSTQFLPVQKKKKLIRKLLHTRGNHNRVQKYKNIYKRELLEICLQTAH